MELISDYSVVSSAYELYRLLGESVDCGQLSVCHFFPPRERSAGRIPTVVGLLCQSHSCCKHNVPEDDNLSTDIAIVFVSNPDGESMCWYYEV